MSWNIIRNRCSTDCSFLDRISVDNYGTTIARDRLHPIIQLSSFFAIKTMQRTDHNRLVILFPNRFDSAVWVSSLCTLEMMRRYFKSNLSEDISYRRGQKLLLDRCVLEFIEESEFEGKRLFRVKCSDGSFGIPLDRKLIFQPSDTKRPLSPIRKVNEAYFACEKNDSPLDNILGIESYDNLSLFRDNLILISKIGTTESSIANNRINGTRLIDLFMWGRLDSHGEPTRLKAGQIAADPTCLVASDLFGASRFMEAKPDTTRGVILDGARAFVNHLQILDDEVLKNGVATVVVADLDDVESLPHLAERGFKIWQWNKQNIISSGLINSTPRASPFYRLNSSLTNYSRGVVDAVECVSSDLSMAYEDIKALGKKVAEVDQLKDPYRQLVSTFLRLSRVVRIPDHDWIAAMMERIHDHENRFLQGWLWAGKDVIDLVGSACSHLLSYLEGLKRGDNSKLSWLTSWLNETQTVPLAVYIIVPNMEDVSMTRDFFGDVCAPRHPRARFLSISDRASIEDTDGTGHVILCGWMGHKKMLAFLQAHAFSNTTLLLYPFERDWYAQAQYHWDRRSQYPIRPGDFSPVFGLPVTDLQAIGHEPKPTAPTHVEVSGFDIIDFELRTESYGYDGYTRIRPGEDTVEARLVLFAHERFSFITENHRLPVVNDIISGRVLHGDIPRKRIEELTTGDYVIFRESDRDIIREIADRGLEAKGLGSLTRIAGLWRQALIRKYEEEGKDVDLIILLLAEEGCKRTRHTIESWLFDDDTIGPKYEADLEAIARTTRDATLAGNTDKVKEAIKTVRGAHLQAAAFLTKKLDTLLTKIIGGQEHTTFLTGDFAELDLDEYGTVSILRIEDVGKDPRKIVSKWVNRLLIREEH
ncbi:MAG: DrmE family protein [Syntrophorhabdus sp.]|nr:DrmE family protein [Syntrophorhabdus sp.]